MDTSKDTVTSTFGPFDWDKEWVRPARRRTHEKSRVETRL